MLFYLGTFQISDLTYNILGGAVGGVIYYIGYRLHQWRKERQDKIILCPGNHDINRKDSNRNEKIQKYRDGGILPNIEACLEGYGKFRESV